MLDGLRWNRNLKYNLEAQLKWLISNVDKVVRRRREDLKSKRSGALACSFEPMIVWVKMFKRPEIATNEDNYIKAVNMCDIFNYILEEHLVSEHHMYILSGGQSARLTVCTLQNKW